MRKVNPLKLTLVVVPIAIILTLLVRYIISGIIGISVHPAITLVIYIFMFAVLKIVGEKVVTGKVTGGEWSWFISDEN